MATIVTRSGKGSPLTNTEVDSNFTNLNTDKLELSGGTMTGNLSFGDSNKAIFGAGSDLQIYHDGNHSRIVETGGGDIIIQGDEFSLMNVAGTEYMIFADNDSFVKLYYDGSAKLATTSTGIDVTGTVTSDGLTVERETALTYGSIDINGTNDSSIRMYNSAGTANFRKMDIRYSAATGYEGLYFRSINDANNDFNEIARFDTKTGDISFYEDTGTTAKFFWDASAERLGLGTSSPSDSLHIYDSSGGATLKIESNTANAYDSSKLELLGGNLSVSEILFGDATDNDVGKIIYRHDGNSLSFNVNAAERMRIDSSGRFGIGTSTPRTTLDVNHPTTNQVAVFRSGDATATIGFADDSTPLTGNLSRVTLGAIGSNMVFNTNSAERMRIDSSGRLLVGKTAPTIATTGVELRPNGQVFATQSGNYPLLLNRTTSDGTIAEFRKDNTTVGSIGTVAGATYYAGTSKSLRINTTGFHPATNAGAYSDDTVDLGHSAGRFKDLHLSGGVNVSESSSSWMGIKGSKLGYGSGSYKATLVGATTGTNSVALGVDMSGNTSGAFSGYSDIFVKNNVGLYQPNAANDDILDIMHWRDSETVFNDSGDNRDFRVESDSNANMLFVDGGSNRVTVGAAGGLTSTFNVSGNAQFANGTGNVGSLSISPSNDRQVITANSPGNYGDYGVTLRSMRATGGSAYINNIDMTYQSTVLNEEGYDVDFRVESDNHSHMLFVDGGNNAVGIATTSPSYALDIAGSFRTRYTVPGFSSITGTSGSANYYKIGTASSLSASRSMKIRILGTSSYSPGNIAGETTILFRGNNSVTTINGTFWSETSGNSHVASVAWKQTGTNDEYDIYVNWASTFAGVDIYVETPGQWAFDVTDTGSESLPSGATAISAVKHDFMGTTQVTSKYSSGLVVNEGSSGAVDFRVESDSNSNMLFVDAGENKVGVNNGNPTATFDVTATGSRPGIYSRSPASQSTQSNSQLVLIDSDNTNLRANFMVEDGTGSGSNGSMQIEVTEAGVSNDRDLRIQGTGKTFFGGYIGGPSRVNVAGTLAITDNAGGQSLLIGNQDSGGASNPFVISVGNGRATFGNGNSWSSPYGGTMTSHLSMGNGTVVVNEDGNDQDFRVESDGNTHALFVDAGTSRVGINKSAPNRALDVHSGTQSDITTFANDSGGYTFGYTSNLASWDLGASDALRFRHGSTETLRLKPTESVFNEGGIDVDFRVESNNNANMLFVDGGNNAVAIGTNSTTHGDLTVFDTGTTGGQLYLSDTTLGVNYGGFIRGKGITGSGGYLYMGTVDANTQVVGYSMAPFAQGHTFYTRSGALGDTAARVNISTTDLVINDPGHDFDFRVESDNQANMLKVDAGNDVVLVGGGTARTDLNAQLQVGSAFGIKSFDINSNTVTDTGISVNQGSGGAACMVLASNHGNVGTATGACQYFLHFYFSGNHMPAVHHVAGSSNILTFGKSANNTLTVQMPAGGNSISFLMNS